MAIAPHTAQVAYLQDGESVRLTPRDFEIRHREHGSITPRIDRIDWKPDAVELGGHAHYMLKEIREQPDTVVDACRGRIRRDEATAQFGGLNLTTRQLRRVRRVVLAACGTSWHAALVGEYLIERLAHLPVEVEYASEFRYRNAPLDDRTLVFVLSQSGETADTLGALREAKRRGHPTLAIVNTVGSTIAREADGGIYLHAGPEVGVASTKAFSAQVAVLTLLALHLGRLRHLSFGEGMAVVEAIDSIPEAIGQALATEPAIKEAAERLAPARSALYLGRDIHFPVALEGALKLKEISYIHAEGYPTAEMKHGPIALIDRETPSVFVAPRGSLHAKTLSNIEEVRARHGPDHRRRDRGGRRARPALRRLPADPGRPRGHPAPRGGRPAPVARLSRRPPPRVRHRQAAQPRQERHRRVSRRRSVRDGLGPLDTRSTQGGCEPAPATGQASTPIRAACGATTRASARR